MRCHSNLFLCNFGGCAREPCKIQGQVLLEFCQPVGSCNDTLYFYRAVLQKIDPIEASVRRADLVLRTNSLLQELLLDTNCIYSERVFITHLVLECIERQKK